MPETPSSQFKRPMSKLSQVGIGLLIVVVIGGLLAWQFSAHLFWKYTEYSLQLKDTHAGVHQVMPETPVPDDWVEIRVGPIELKLPPEVAANGVPPTPEYPVYGFHTGWSDDTRPERFVSILEPDYFPPDHPFLEMAAKLSPDKQPFTMNRLRYECFKKDARDFRWSMTSEEVRWHQFCMTSRTFMPSWPMEYFQDDRLNATLFVLDEGHYSFQWETRTWPLSGMIVFEDGRESADHDWVRAVCQSIKIHGENWKEEDLPVEEGP